MSRIALLSAQKPYSKEYNCQEVLPNESVATKIGGISISSPTSVWTCVIYAVRTSAMDAVAVDARAMHAIATQQTPQMICLN